MTYADRALQYAHDVLQGRVLACKWVKAACQRQLDDLAKSESDPSWPYYFDSDAANRICQFIELLPHIKGDWAKPVWIDGRPTYPKIKLEDWQVFTLAVPFGWMRRGPEQGRRRFTRIYEEEARKNAKSTKAAGVALYMLAADGEQGAEVYTAATKKEQARIIWEVASNMVAREPDFRSLGIGHNKSSIYNELSAGKFQPLARDFGSLDGLNTHCFISDEVHAQDDRGLYDVLDSSTGARSQPLGMAITTAGTNRAGICWELRSHTTKVLNTTLHQHNGMGYKIKGSAAVDDNFFGIIYTLDTDYADQSIPDDDWADPANWIKANPNLNVSVSVSDLQSKLARAIVSPGFQGEFRTKHCNQWLGADSSWMDMSKWNACGNPSLHPSQFMHDHCVVALDAAFRRDIFAKVKIFRIGDTYTSFESYYCSHDYAYREGNEHIKTWVEQGYIKVSDGPVLDIELVREDLQQDAHDHIVDEVPYDPAQLTQFAGEMIEDGVEMVEIRPTVMNFSEPMKFLDNAVQTGNFTHAANPVTEWMIANVVCHKDRKDNIYPIKESDAAKIDGAVAMIMAMARAMVCVPQEESDGFVQI